MEAIGEQGQLDTSITRPIEEVESGYSQFSNGDVVIAKITPCFENGKGSLIRGMLGGIGYGTTELHVLTPGPEIDGRFLYYITVDPRFRRLGEANMTGAAGQQRVPEEFIRNYLVPVPPLNVQRAIADYLDRETARIDALIAAKERLLALLAEKRRALITRAVTRGLDPNAPMKDSGIPWLGEIPAHWTAIRINHVVTLRRSRVQSDEERKPYIGLEHIESWTGRLVSDLSSADEAAVSATRESDSLSSTFEPGDVLFGKLRPYLAKAWVAEFAGRCTTEALVMQPVAVEARFLRYVFLCPDFIDLVDASTFGSKMPRADWDFIGNIKIPLPPATEQRAIVEHITEETARLDALRAATERSIALLKERRAALISAAVTGQIDVPACAASTADREAVP
jgi:restriction endonuclease S subunit